MPSIQELFHQLTDKLSGWLEALVLMLPNALLAILVATIFGLGSRLVQRFVYQTLDRFSNNLAITRLLSRLSMIGVILLGLFLSLGILQLRDTVLTLLSGIGIVGLALGFAFQDIAANFISGILIAVRKPFTIGDLIEVDGNMGTIITISMRTTIIRLFQGQDLIVPNKKIYQGMIKKYTTGMRRVDIPLGVSYGEDLAEVQATVLSVLEDLEAADHEKGVECFFTEYGDSSINLEARFWMNLTTQGNFFAARSEAIMNIKQAFDKRGITIPFPIRTLDFGIKGGESLQQMLSVPNGSPSTN